MMDHSLTDQDATNDAQVAEIDASIEAPASETASHEPEGETAPSPPPPAPPPAHSKKEERRKWFVIHTYSGYENKVKANLERRIHSMNMADKIFRVLVPMEDEVEFKDGKRKITPKKVFPGYVLVEMDMDDGSWYVVRNTSGVTGFLSSPGISGEPATLPEQL